jgi:uncharacterized protein with HEPN domain
LKPKSGDSLLYLEDIHLAMERIQEYIAGLNFQRFKLDYKIADAVIRNLEIIGEASKNLPKSIKDNYSDVPWEEMYRLRNRISHEYFGIDYDIIWEIIPKHLPKNHSDVKAILKDESSSK